MRLIDGVDPLTYLLSFLGDDMKLKYLGSRTTIGDWILTGLTPMNPVILIGDCANNDPGYVLYQCTKGSDYSKLGQNKVLGTDSTIRSHTNIEVPTEDSITLNMKIFINGFIVHAFTGE